MKNRVFERCLLLGGVLLLGCPSKPTGPPPTTQAPLTAQLLQLTAFKEGQERPVALTDKKDALRAKESFAVTVQVNLPSYLYVVRSGGRGAVQLFPDGGAVAAITPAGQTRLPTTGGTWVNAGEFDSTDLVCVIASVQVLATGDLSCQPLARGRGEDDPTPAPPPQRSAGGSDPPPPPPPPPMDTRKPELLQILQIPLQRG